MSSGLHESRVSGLRRYGCAGQLLGNYFVDEIGRRSSEASLPVRAAAPRTSGWVSLVGVMARVGRELMICCLPSAGGFMKVVGGLEVTRWS
ncbi:hypothetical protein FEAC_01820 [Ferrimicrobium acidiphilum DSM 19497]|uniref:Uncharacterized protein n=1 Tax=Ferrimicrobium acidiphilum DSM 19497 TaxID=1121877 RepID=A0A0D8FY88_9ACTN|nr:hypothetical protein FEAC_01820 [Ferrimicrobium acidiphilum DSM 19497]